MFLFFVRIVSFPQGEEFLPIYPQIINCFSDKLTVCRYILFRDGKILLNKIFFFLQVCCEWLQQVGLSAAGMCICTSARRFIAIYSAILHRGGCHSTPRRHTSGSCRSGKRSGCFFLLLVYVVPCCCKVCSPYTCLHYTCRTDFHTQKPFVRDLIPWNARQRQRVHSFVISACVTQEIFFGCIIWLTRCCPSWSPWEWNQPKTK